MRRSDWVGQPISLKPDTSAEGMDVYAAGISLLGTMNRLLSQS